MGVERIAEIGYIIMDQLVVNGIDGVFPNDAHLASRGKIPYELEISRKRIEIDVSAIDEIRGGKRSILFKGVKGKIFCLRPVMPGAQGQRGFRAENIPRAQYVADGGDVAPSEENGGIHKRIVCCGDPSAVVEIAGKLDVERY